MKRGSIGVALCAVLWMAGHGTLAMAADIYRWTDSDGRVHYGASPPPGVKASMLSRVDAAPAGPAASDAQARADRLKAQAEQAARQRAAEQARAQADAQERERARADRVQRCAQAAQQLSVVQRGGPVWQLDAQGQRVFLPDDQRDAQIARLRAEVAAHCDAAGGAEQAEAIRQRTKQGERAALCAQARDELQLQQAGRAPDWQVEATRKRVQQLCGP